MYVITKEQWYTTAGFIHLDGDVSVDARTSIEINRRIGVCVGILAKL